jgi:electron transfer flavoprotein beta subunit
MKIVACIKYSLDVSEIKVDPETEALSLAGVPKKVGNIDKNVLEAAVSLAEAYEGTVHAVTFGPAASKDSYKEALAMGLEDVILIEDPLDGEGSPAVTAAVLAAAVEKIGDVDLIICGEVSDDGFTYQVPPRLAERLGLPQVSFARQITVENGKVIVERELEDGSQIVSAPMPALISITEETNTPRRPTLMEAMQAKKKPVHLWQVEEELGLSKRELAQKVGLERIETKGLVVHRKQIGLKGDDMTALAGQLVDLLVEENILEGGS